MPGALSFSTAELAALQAAQDAHMMDACTIDAYSTGAADAYGNPSDSWASGSEMDCGFEQAKPREIMGTTRVPEWDARLRLPIETSVDPRDRITVTKRHGVAVTPVTYEILGSPRRGPSGLVVDLVRITDGS